MRKGQVLCALEDRDLQLENDRWSSERDQHLRELREAMAKHDMAQVQVVGAQVRQAEAQLALVAEKLARARVVAPFDGVVITRRPEPAHWLTGRAGQEAVRDCAARKTIA